MAVERSTTPDFDERLNELFDDLVAEMRRPGFSEAVEQALFGDTETLNKAIIPAKQKTRSDLH